MDRLNEILRELGISKVKLAKFLGVSRQMIYNYLELDDLNKWPKDKKVLLLNLLGIKSAEELDSIKVDTDYILEVETRINSLFEHSTIVNSPTNASLDGLNAKQKELMNNIIDIMKEQLEDDDEKESSYQTYKYLYNYLQTMESSKELKYILAYMAKAAGFVKPMEFVYNEEVPGGCLSIDIDTTEIYNYKLDTITTENGSVILTYYGLYAMPDEIGPTTVTNNKNIERVLNYDQEEDGLTDEYYLNEAFKKNKNDFFKFVYTYKLINGKYVLVDFKQE